MPDAHSSSAKTSSHANFRQRCLSLLFAALTSFVAGCVSPPPAPVTPPAAAPAPTPVVVTPPTPPPEPAPLPVAVAPSPPPVAIVAAPKEAPPVALPSYARRGRRLPADGGAPGLAVMRYCRSFEIEKDAVAYFKRLQREKRLPTDADIAERNRQADVVLTLQQYVERDWALRRDNNKSVPQKCKVLGGSVDGATAHVVFEADLNGRRQRGTAAVIATAGKWRLRDHGDWSPVSAK